ncbi:hypothetical protein CALCODRAFT_512808 [Calocera cornea HHB12733]|uniref:Zinc finger GRF-type domain-containing protein n=1 Tax=Calocera cornea HHB12733 TaxID=1353952 RepID=A0A165CRK0_9BASI|nr:hypothetical protein CALCODRAFT_512808 [Calocera cornea HHB12733]
MQPFRPDRFRFSLSRQAPSSRQQTSAGQPDEEQPQMNRSYTEDDPMDGDAGADGQQGEDGEHNDDRAPSPPAAAPTSIPPGHRVPQEDLPAVLYPAPVYTYNLRPRPGRTASSSRPADPAPVYPSPGPSVTADGHHQDDVQPSVDRQPASRAASPNVIGEFGAAQPAHTSRRPASWQYNLRADDDASSTVPTEPRRLPQPAARSARPPSPPPSVMATPRRNQPVWRQQAHHQPAGQPAAPPAAVAQQSNQPAPVQSLATVEGEPGIRLMTFDEWDRLTRAQPAGPWSLDWWPEGLPFTPPDQWATRHFWSGELHLDFTDPDPDDPWIPCQHCKKAHWFISTQKNPGQRFYKCPFNRHPEDCRMFSYQGPLVRDGKIKLTTVVFPPGIEPDRYPPANLIVRPPQPIDPRIEYLRDMRNRENQRRYNELQETYRRARAEGEKVRAAREEAAQQAAAREEAAKQEAIEQAAARQEAARREAVKQEQATQAAAVRPAEVPSSSHVGPEHYAPGESPMPETGAAAAPSLQAPNSPTPPRPPPRYTNIPALRRTNTASFANTYASLTGRPYPKDTSQDLVPTAGQPPVQGPSSRHPTPRPQPQPMPGSRVPTPVVRPPTSRLPTPAPRIPTPMPPPVHSHTPAAPPAADPPATASPPAPRPATAPVGGVPVASAAPTRQWRGPATNSAQTIPVRIDKGKGWAAEKRAAEDEPDGAPPARRPRQGSGSTQRPGMDRHYWPIGTAPDPEHLRLDLAALASTGGPQTRLTLLHLMAGIIADPNAISHEMRELIEPILNQAIEQEGRIVVQEEERRRYDDWAREHRAPR